MTKLPYPSTFEDFIKHYKTHSREELVQAVADLHVRNLELAQELQSLREAVKKRGF